ncbi:MAG: VOC family protein [Gaiellaceae bacterium]
MTRYLHTMLRITDFDTTRAFYEALGLEFRREMDIVRNGEREATNYFFGVPGQEEELVRRRRRSALPTGRPDPPSPDARCGPPSRERACRSAPGLRRVEQPSSGECR